MLIEDELADSRVNNLVLHHAVNFFIHPHLDARMERDNAVFVCHHGLVHIGEDLALALVAVFYERQVVAAQYHVLRRHGNRLAVLRL